uniref:Uncharacterized protein n=1 Tax=Arundo donax TaxID=35708 RepID=A0A0A9BEY1_ARUDO
MKYLLYVSYRREVFICDCWITLSYSASTFLSDRCTGLKASYYVHL